MFLSACQSVFDNVKTSRDVALEAVNEEIFLDQSNLWSYIANQQKLEINNNPRIQQQLGWFKKHPDYLTRISERAQPYLYLVVKEIEKEGDFLSRLHYSRLLSQLITHFLIHMGLL